MYGYEPSNGESLTAYLYTDCDEHILETIEDSLGLGIDLKIIIIPAIAVVVVILLVIYCCKKCKAMK